MKCRLYILLAAALLCASPAALMMPQYAQAATTGTSGKKQNLLSNTQCIVFEPNYKAESSQSLTPGTTFAKDPYVKSEALYDAYCFVRVEIPTAQFTLSNGKTVIADAVKMLYNSSEGIKFF